MSNYNGRLWTEEVAYGITYLPPTMQHWVSPQTAWQPFTPALTKPYEAHMKASETSSSNWNKSSRLHTQHLVSFYWLSAELILLLTIVIVVVLIFLVEIGQWINKMLKISILKLYSLITTEMQPIAKKES